MTRPLGTIMVREETIDLDAEFGDLSARAISEGMSTVSALMGRVASLWGEAAEEQVEVDAKYRAWRGKHAAFLLQEDPKTPEWKVKLATDAAPPFLECKAEIARTEHNVITLKGLFFSLDEKGSQLQSRGAMARAELDAVGMHTPDEDPPPRSSPTARKDIRGLTGKKHPVRT